MTDTSLLPDGITTCQINFGKALSFLGKGASISGTLSAVFGDGAGRLTEARVVHVASGVALYSGDDNILTVSAGDELSFAVPHVDQPGFHDGSGAAVTMWAYVFAGIMTIGKKKITVTKTFQPLVGQTDIDLDLVPDGTAATPVAITPPTFLASSARGAAGGVAPLDSGSRVPDANLPARLQDTALSNTLGPGGTAGNVGSTQVAAQVAALYSVGYDDDGIPFLTSFAGTPGSSVAFDTDGYPYILIGA